MLGLIRYNRNLIGLSIKRRTKMKNKALLVIDLQNDITKNYKRIIEQVNTAIDWAASNDMHVIYIKQYNLSEKTSPKPTLLQMRHLLNI